MDIWQYIGGALIGGTVTIIGLILNRIWTKNDKKNEEPIQNVKRDLEKLKKKHEEDNTAINSELSIICYGVLAANKGLAEKGCDGPVHEAILMIEDHLNKKAHS